MTNNGTINPADLRLQAIAYAKRRRKHREEARAIRERGQELCTQMYAAGISIAEQAELIGSHRQYIDKHLVDKEAARKLSEELAG